jgi:nucleoside-diphosphate-sugar epimerase
VGRHLVAELLRRGHDVWIVDNLFTGRAPEAWLDGFSMTADVPHQTFTNESQTVHFFKADAAIFFHDLVENKMDSPFPHFDEVFHLASVVGGRELIDGDPLLVATDLAIDSYFMRWAAHNKDRITRVLYASSSAAYPVSLQAEGHEKTLPLKEEMIQHGGNLGQPDMTYGWSKLTGEYLSRLAAERYGLRIACVRPFSGYGEDQDPSYPIPAIARRAAAREAPLTVWGTGEQARDFVHIDDCVQAMFHVLDNVTNGDGVNIGSGKPTTFLEIAKLYAKLEGYEPEVKPLIDKPTGVTSRFSDSSLLESWGWRPAISLEEGLGRVLAHAHEVIDAEADVKEPTHAHSGRG